MVLDLLPQNKSYYQHSGSLTFPPCTENVLWTILSNPVTVPEPLIRKFYSIHRNAKDQGKSILLSNNFRILQAYNGRKVDLFLEGHIHYGLLQIELGIFPKFVLLALCLSLCAIFVIVIFLRCETILAKFAVADQYDEIFSEDASNENENFYKRNPEVAYGL